MMEGVFKMDKFMVIYFISVLFVSMSIGVYIKLMHYGAPASSIFYSFMVPLAVLVINFKYLIKFSMEEKTIKDSIITFFIVIWINIKNLSIYTGILSAYLGASKIGITDLIRAVLGSNIKFMLEKINKLFRSYDNKIFSNYKNDRLSLQ